MVIDVLLIVSMVGFVVAGRSGSPSRRSGSWARSGACGNPIFAAWYEPGLDPATRATVGSIGGQADAVGQAVARPVIDGVARGVSVPWAISLADLLPDPDPVALRACDPARDRRDPAARGIDQELELAEE